MTIDRAAIERRYILAQAHLASLLHPADRHILMQRAARSHGLDPDGVLAASLADIPALLELVVPNKPDNEAPPMYDQGRLL